MEKAKVSAKWIKESFGKRLSIGYCSIQFLLKYEEPEYYTCGGSGWNSDNYYFPEYGLLVSTGYNPVSGTIKVDYNLMESYNNKAKQAIAQSTGYDTDSEKKRMKEVSKLLDEFLQEVTK
jgi:hypothetical protein